MAVHLHLLVVAFILLVPTPQQAQGNVSHFSPMDDLSPKKVRIRFNVVTGDYQTFLKKLFEVLKSPTHRDVGGIPVLAQQRKDSVPARWIYVKFVAARVKTTIAIRDDNVYIVAFTNITGHWFEFESPAHLLTGSSVLPFGGGYNDLLGEPGETGAYKKLKDIKLGKAKMLEAVRTLALHNPNRPNPELKVVLATLCVVVAEASRFRPIDHEVAQGWNGTPQITADQANLVVLWGDISRELLDWQKTKVWTDKKGKLREKAKINDPDDALRTLRLVVCPLGVSC